MKPVVQTLEEMNKTTHLHRFVNPCIHPLSNRSSNQPGFWKPDWFGEIGERRILFEIDIDDFAGLSLITA